MQSRVVMLVDLDYFFAQCEERRNPLLKSRPVVVCVYSGRTEESGSVATANYVARRYGVKSGIPIFQAKRKLAKADAVFLPVDRPFYGEVSDSVMRILESHADRFEQVGIDEAYLDVTERVKGDFKLAEELARNVREEVRTRVGLTCSVGVGPNKLVAKIAACFRKPNGLTVVKPDDVEGFLAPLPVDSLIGVGKKTAERMESLGIMTIGDLASYDVQKLFEAFGRKLGTYFRCASVGIDESPVERRGEAESISRISTLKEDTRDLRIIVEKASHMCDEVHRRLAQRSLSFKLVSVLAVLTDMSIHSRSRTLESPADDLEVLRNTAEELFRKLLGEVALEVRRVGVKVAALVNQEQTQKHLTDFGESGSG